MPCCSCALVSQSIALLKALLPKSQQILGILTYRILTVSLLCYAISLLHADLKGIPLTPDQVLNPMLAAAHQDQRFRFEVSGDEIIVGHPSTQHHHYHTEHSLDRRT